MTQGMIVWVLLMGVGGLIWVIVRDLLGDGHHAHENREGSGPPK